MKHEAEKTSLFLPLSALFCCFTRPFSFNQTGNVGVLDTVINRQPVLSCFADVSAYKFKEMAYHDVQIGS